MIPDSLKTNKSIYSYYLRYKELEDINPIVSYYCKLKVLETILSLKLHINDKSVEQYVLELLDNTESIKNSDDDDIKTVLGDKNLSIGLVLNFSLKIYNQCLGELANYNGHKVPLVSKLRASINFLGLLELFKNDSIDWNKLTGNKVDNYQDFEQLNKERIKLLKYNLSKLMKDEIEIKGEEQELEALTKAVEGHDQQDQNPDDGQGPEVDEEPETDQETKLGQLPTLGSGQPLEHQDDHQPQSPKLPSAPKTINTADLDQDNDSLPSAPSVNLPGAPHFSPEESDDLKLPGAPKFLPDDDLSHINKDSSILIIPPGDKESHDATKPGAISPSSPTKPSTIAKPTSISTDASTSSVTPKHHEPLTKDKLNIILNKQETISKVQKLCKFAISALNYEDLNTAQRELTEGLALIKVLQENDDD